MHLHLVHKQAPTSTLTEADLDARQAERDMPLSTWQRLDAAITSQMTHGAAALADPGTELLAEQLALPTSQAFKDLPRWRRWGWSAVVLLATACALLPLVGCGGGDPEDIEADAREGIPRPVDCQALPDRCR